MIRVNPSLLSTCNTNICAVLHRLCFRGETQIEVRVSSVFSLSFSSFSLNNYHHHHHHDGQILSMLQRYPPTRRILQQIYSQIVTAGSFHDCTDIQILIFNTLLRHYSLSQFPQEAISMYKQLHQTSLSPSSYFDSFTYSFLAKACANLNHPASGIQVHAQVIRAGFGNHVYVQTALLDMYVVCGFVDNARQLFDEMPERNLVTWNAMITGLIGWGQMDAAQDLFDEMTSRNIVSWTGMIDGYTRMRNYLKAFSMFRRMVTVAGIMPSEITFLAIFPAIVNLGDLKNCHVVHAYGDKKGFNVGDIRLTNCLIDAYAKCGCIKSASKVFEDMSDHRRNLVSWTSIISGFAMHGMSKEAVESFEAMERRGLKPNHVTFLSVITACSHGGLVDEGLEFFQKMINECQLLPEIKHYGCVIDMLGRAGRLGVAEEIAWGIPDDVANVVIWRTLLGACSFFGDVERAKRVTRKMQDMEKGYGGDYILMSNILTGTGEYDDAEKVRNLMDERKVSKVPGRSFG